MWFFIISLFGGKKYLPSSLCILFCIAVNVVWIKLLVEQGVAGSFTERKEFLIDLEGVTALILTMFLYVDKTAWKQALLLSFATLCHIMIISSIKQAHAGFFYTWYDELIIAVGLLQMMVSYDGFIGALSNLQALLLRTYHYFNRTVQDLPIHKKSKERA